MDDAPANPLSAEQQRRNRSRDGEWELSSSHRRRLTENVVNLAPPHLGRLCVLGAGNLNDLDLVALGEAFGEIHLVDIDGEALQRGVRRQFPAVSTNKLVLHPGIDLTAIWHRLTEQAAIADWQSAVWDELVVQALEPGTFGLPAPFDVVVSAGVLSQLVEAVVRMVPSQAPRFWDLLLAVRTGHLRLTARLTTPGGHCLIASDFVSSATCPALAATPEQELPALAHRLAQEHNFFHGLNPSYFEQLFTTDRVLCELVAEVRHAGYWLWRQRARTYAVMAFDCLRGT